jgi:hypothetical protein
MRFPFAAATCMAFMLFAPFRAAAAGDGPLTVLVLGDAGENTSALRGCGTYATGMLTGQHDGGRFQAMIFLGNNFFPTGLNIPAADVEKKVRNVLEPFKIPLEELGRNNVHAIAGNHDYYARHAIESSLFFGLVKIEEAPMGLTDRGNRREAEIETWTYHCGLPGEATYALEPGSKDSAQFIFVDSALPLRTDVRLWIPALDSLRRLLHSSAFRPGIRWRILCMHHPFTTVGEHGGYTVWDDESNTVERVTPCDRDTNALAWFMNSLDPEDACADRYRWYMDSLASAIRSGGAKVHLALSAHDHSLQLLRIASRADDPVPAVQVISGAAATPAMVRFPSPPEIFTSARLTPSHKGESLPGFVQLRFTREKLGVRFFNGDNGDLIDMGGGAKQFWIGQDGVLARQGM